MYRRYFPLALIVVALLSGCSLAARAGSGRYVEKEYDLTDFARLDISSAVRYEVVRGDAYAVRLRLDDTLVSRLIVEKRGDTLRIGLRPSMFGATRVEAYITMPALEGFNASGATTGSIAGFKSTKPFELHLSGASRLSGDLEAGDMQVHIDGASNAQLAGRVRNLDLEISGASGADFFDLEANDVSVHLSGASRANIHVAGTLNCDVSGASRLRYDGNPRMGDVNSSGASSISAR